MAIIDFVVGVLVITTIFMVGFSVGKIHDRPTIDKLMSLLKETERAYMYWYGRSQYYEDSLAARSMKDKSSAYPDRTWAEAKKLLKLCHPDNHPPERKELANEICRNLIEKYRPKRS